MDVRQFLLDAPETCFFTCYDLLLHTNGGSAHHLEDYHEIREVADITSGGCTLEMIAAIYDERSIRAHVYRTRELLSLSTPHSSLSTSLALQHEMGQNATANSGDQSKKTEVLELENLGFMEDVSGSLSNLLSSPSKEIKCAGYLIYLDVVTLEGIKYCITGTTTTFYVNASSGNTLDPKPTKAASEATTLIGLLQKINSKFKKDFREMLERKASTHPFENIQSLLPPNSWLGLHPVPDHRRDAARAKKLTYFIVWE
ncbi:putative clustered mitochondria protein [Helianthus annuus]|nr:putative clustered mitochondria protein [Helianthus annuus]KAJ0929555.1 putative clustered mitochondria protein [Helianthus annuus]